MEIEHIFNKLAVKTYVIDDNIWFIAKEIAQILDYKDTDKAIRNNVDNEDKVELSKIIGPAFKAGLLYNDSKRICINESGLYSLLLKSKKKEAKIFKRWVTSEVLPSIRKQGKYDLEKEKEQMKIDFECKLKIVEQKAEKEYQKRIEQEELLKKEREEKQLLEEHLLRYKKFEKDELIYVLTNKNDLKNNVFKIGKTTKKNYKNRLAQYNTGSSVENYYIYLKECFDAKLIEKQFSYHLEKYKLRIKYEDQDKTNDELYKLHIDDLLYVLNSLTLNQTTIGDYMNLNHEKIFRRSVSKLSEVCKISDWNKKKKELKYNFSDKTIEIKDDILNNNNELRNWLFSIIEEDKNSFVSLHKLIDKYKEAFPYERNLKIKEIENMIKSSFSSKGIFVKEQHNVRENGVQKKNRNVFIGFKIKALTDI